MALNLSTELREFVDDEIRSGNYSTEGAVIADALLRMKEERERIAWLKAEVQKGVDSLNRGEGRPFDVDAAIERVNARRRAQGQEPI